MTHSFPRTLFSTETTGLTSRKGDSGPDKALVSSATAELRRAVALIVSYERLEPSSSPAAQVSSWLRSTTRVHPPLQKFLSSLSFLVDLILPALSHCNAHWFTLAFHIYTAHLQCFSSCHIKANFCAP